MITNQTKLSITNVYVKNCLGGNTFNTVKLIEIIRGLKPT
jgi:hypothetical protein